MGINKPDGLSSITHSANQWRHTTRKVAEPGEMDFLQNVYCTLGQPMLRGRLQPPREACSEDGRLNFGQFTTREVVLDEEYWFDIFKPDCSMTSSRKSLGGQSR